MIIRVKSSQGPSCDNRLPFFLEIGVDRSPLGMMTIRLKLQPKANDLQLASLRLRGA